MSLTNTCFEIVHFAFRDDVPLTRQPRLMTLLGHWASTQVGFFARQSYHDPQSNRWTDIVEWRSLPQAQAAMALSQNATTLAAVMGSIAQDPFLIGHYDRLV